MAINSTLKNNNLSAKENENCSQKVSSTTFDLVDVHLFHDADNMLSFGNGPSVFSNNRQKALLYTLSKIGENGSSQIADGIPFFIFGDFNFRLNGQKVIEKLLSDSESHKKEIRPKSLPQTSNPTMLTNRKTD